MPGKLIGLFPIKLNPIRYCNKISKQIIIIIKKQILIKLFNLSTFFCTIVLITIKNNKNLKYKIDLIQSGYVLKKKYWYSVENITNRKNDNINKKDSLSFQIIKSF